MLVNNNKFNIVASNIAPNPMSVKYWADLSEDTNGNVVKTYNGTNWEYVNSSIINALANRIKKLEDEVFKVPEEL